MKKVDFKSFTADDVQAGIVPDNFLHLPLPCGAEPLMSWAHGCAGTPLEAML